MHWSCLLHIYQPPWQKKEILKKVIRESYLPILEILERNKKVKITLNICASLTEFLIKYNFEEILKRIKNLAENGQIELTGSAIYHPILPLLPKTEVIRQIKLNENLNQKYFKKTWRPRPEGFFLPELCYDKKIARIIESLGYKWIILDEIAYNGEIGKVSFDKRYQIKDLRLEVIFRNRGLSDIFYTGWLDSEEKFWQALKNDGRSNNFLITAFDGENLGHHKPGTEKIFEKLVNKIETLTISELFKKYQEEKIIEPILSSWSTREIDLKEKIYYPLWFHPKNKIHQLQWQLTYLAIKQVNKYKEDEDYREARKLLDEALASDQYWWASAQPWWSQEIIKEGAEKLTEVLKILKNLDKKIIEKAEKIKEKIISTAKEWQKSGFAEKIKNDYLRG